MDHVSCKPGSLEVKPFLSKASFYLRAIPFVSLRLIFFISMAILCLTLPLYM